MNECDEQCLVFVHCENWLSTKKLCTLFMLPKIIVHDKSQVNIVKVIQGAVEDVQLPLTDEDWSLFCSDKDDIAKEEYKNDQQVVDIIISSYYGSRC